MPILKKTYKDQVIDHVYQLMLAGELGAGDQLKESLLAAQMGISRAPIREAMKELIIIGLVEYRPQVGNFIPVLTAKQIVDSYTTRGVLEGYAVMESCHLLSTDDLSRLDLLVEEMVASARNSDHKRVVEAGGEFHDLLISRCNNVQLLEYTNRLSLKLHIQFYKYWGRLYDAAGIGRRHGDIVQCLRAAEPTAIEQVVRQHYVETGTRIAELQ
jgi:DNA-binding GntR family transcriptional regulator